MAQDISLNELDKLIASYYGKYVSINNRDEEADKVSIRIAKLLSDDSFSLSFRQYLFIHKYFFDGLLDNIGELRTYNF